MSHFHMTEKTGPETRKKTLLPPKEVSNIDV